MGTGAAIAGGTAFVAGVVIVGNIVGFPEVEIGEGAGLLAVAGEPVLSMFWGGVNLGAYGTAVGGFAGFIVTPPKPLSYILKQPCPQASH